MKFKLHSIDSGFCRIYYTTKNSEGQKIIYCLQDEGDRFGGVQLYRCSKEGEPEFITHFKEGIKAIDSMEKPMGETELEKRVRHWIETH